MNNSYLVELISFMKWPKVHEPHLHVYQCYRVEQLMIPPPGEMDNTRGNRKGKWYTAGTEEGEG